MCGFTVFSDPQRSMLNYIWLALIVLGIAVALWNDASDLYSNKYHNGEEVAAVLTVPGLEQKQLEPSKSYSALVTINPQDYGRVYGSAPAKAVAQRAELIPSREGEAVLRISVDAETPREWREIAAASQSPGVLAARFTWSINGSGELRGNILTEPVKFVKMNAVANEGIIKYAKNAVELAIGLIGIMALWLGVMKIAEQSGLVSKLAALIKPVTTRLFPDVPPDHPAMGAMIMNISANMLGLANAATPLGLKAMEELNKLNRRVGTATDAMCTFLVINTSNVQLIPATVIAIRAAAGSSDPTEILGPVLVATCVSITAGLTSVKLLSKLKIFRLE